MKILTFIILILFLSVDICQCQENISYTVDRNRTYIAFDSVLQYDRYHNNNKASKASVILLHGGAYQKLAGEKEKMMRIAIDLSEAGYQVFNINYLTDDINLDLKTVFWKSACTLDQFLRHISTNPHYDVDLDNIFLLGHSAGAILALGYQYFDTDDIGDNYFEQLYKFGEIRRSSVTISGVIAFAGGWVDTEHITDSPMMPLLMIHQEDDPIIPYHSGTVFTELGDIYNGVINQIQEVINDEVSNITSTMGITEMGIENEVNEEMQKLTVNHIYGSAKIYEAFSDESNHHCRLVLKQGHNHRISKLYTPDVKDEMLKFLDENESKEIIDTSELYDSANQFITLHKKKIYVTFGIMFGLYLVSYIFKL